nr:hypothetical protein [Angustibacter aerolatus]
MQASGRADADAAEARRAAAVRGDSARALYMSGGQAGLVSTLLSAGDPQDLALRVVGMRQVMAGANDAADTAAEVAAGSRAEAGAAEAAADRSVVVAADLADDVAASDALLRRAQARLDALGSRAARLEAAERAARALAAARRAAAAARAAALATVHAQAAPSVYFDLYHQAATTCAGMDWTLLAAVGQVESGHGRNVGPRLGRGRRADAVHARDVPGVRRRRRPRRHRRPVLAGRLGVHRRPLPVCERRRPRPGRRALGAAALQPRRVVRAGSCSGCRPRLAASPSTPELLPRCEQRFTKACSGEPLLALRHDI